VLFFEHSAKILPRAKPRLCQVPNGTTLGKDSKLCRVPGFWHSTKFECLPSAQLLTLDKLQIFAECLGFSTRQRGFPGGPLWSPCAVCLPSPAPPALSKRPLCRVSVFSHSANHLALGKEAVSGSGHWNSGRTPLSSMAQLLQYRCTVDAPLQNRRKNIIKVNVMLQMRKKTCIKERKKSDLWPPTIVKVHFKPFNCKIGQQRPFNY